ncbi:GAMETE EXPRESSED 2-like protein [Drosera capensis]
MQIIWCTQDIRQFPPPPTTVSNTSFATQPRLQHLTATSPQPLSTTLSPTISPPNNDHTLHNLSLSWPSTLGSLLFLSLTPADPTTATTPSPLFVFSWLNDTNTFLAGDTAASNVKVLGDFAPGHLGFVPVVSVNGKEGNSTLVIDMGFEFGEDDVGRWRIRFVVVIVGVFNVEIREVGFGVMDSLHYFLNAGPMHPAVSVVSWMDSLNEFEAGTRAMILILPKDAYGNNSAASVLTVTNLGWNEFGYLRVDFIVATAGDLLLHVEEENLTLKGSPLLYKVKPGLYPFDADIFEQGTNLSIPIADLLFREISPGIQLLSFMATETGNFLLVIYDTKHNRSISDMPYDFTVFVGYCYAIYSIVNGSGLNESTAGEEVKFSSAGTSKVWLMSMKLHLPQKRVEDYGPNSAGFELPPSVEDNTTVRISRDLKSLAYVYEVAFTPEKSGAYDVFVSCGVVNTSLSGVLKYAPKIQKQMKNEIVVQLMDSFHNPVTSQQGKLELKIGSMNNSGFVSWTFLDNNDGSYVGEYLLKDVDTYEICASFDGYCFLPCIFGVNAYSNHVGGAQSLTLVGNVEAINIALMSVQYIGNDIFYGDDTIKISVRNNNGVNDLNVSVVVLPVNDPPFVNIPEYILLDEKDHWNGILIYNHERDKFEFLIGDPDFDNFPGEKSHFLVSCSVQVASGFLEASLPAELIYTTEIKLKYTHQWQPLQTFVTISKHFVVRAKGLRFDGTINDCNSIIQQLKYHAGKIMVLCSQ